MQDHSAISHGLSLLSHLTKRKFFFSQEKNDSLQAILYRVTLINESSTKAQQLRSIVLFSHHCIQKGRTKLMLENIFYKQRQAFEQEIQKQNEGLKCPSSIQMVLMEHLDVFSPSSDKPLPVIINIHGGGLIMGAKEFNHKLCIRMAEQGYLVFAITYPLVPDANAFQQFQAIQDALFMVKKELLYWNGDQSHIYITADSAGAYLAVYSIAMQHLPELAKAAGVTPMDLPIRAMALFSGMFFTNRFDKIGLTMPKYLYGKHYKKHPFAPYINPTHPDILRSLPPCFFTTSTGDFLESYTIDFYNEFIKYHKSQDCDCIRIFDKTLPHAFPAFLPEHPETTKCLTEMNYFFRMH